YGPAGPVVEQALRDAWVLAAGKDHGDLGVACLQPVHVFADGPSDVAVEALLDVERDAEHRPGTAPLVGELRCLRWIEARVKSADVDRFDLSRIADRFEHASIQP